jgi:2,4-dienoyl-CoA reductase (NADPH2)
VSSPYPHLLAPGRIGSLILRNRIVMTPMGSNLGEGDGSIGTRTHAYYAARARGGAGMVIMGSVAVAWPLSSVIPRQAAIAEESHVPGIRELARLVHAAGCKLALQLHFGGLMSTVDAAAGRPLWTPSVPAPKPPGDMAHGILEEEFAALAAPLASAAPSYRVMTTQDIDTLVSLFAAAAERAQRAGVDGVEIHAGHGYIISAFLSPNSNHRTDTYGGSVGNRTRLLTDVIRGIRAAVGVDYPVWCRIDSKEYFQPEGITLEDAKVTAKLAELAGADAIHVSAYAEARHGVAHSSAHTPQKPDLLVPNATTIRAAVNIPVIAVGHIEPHSAERHIAAGDFDFVAMGRKLLADPELPRKLGTPGELIRPCVYNYSCNSQIYIGGNVNCAVNPETGHEAEFAAVPAARAKRVVVIGGGPAGLECARRLAQRGHTVTVVERSARLGGALRVAAVCYEPFAGLLHWLLRSIEATEVDVRLGTAPSAQAIAELTPDLVVLALGSQPAESPAAPSQQQDTAALLTQAAEGIVSATVPSGRQSVVLGNDVVALEIAAHLARHRHAVTVLDRGKEFGRGAPLVRRWRLLDDLRRMQVNLIGGAQQLTATPRTVSYRTHFGQVRTLPADQMISAGRVENRSELAAQLQELGIMTRAIGDCAQIGYLAEAMQAAARVALEA